MQKIRRFESLAQLEPVDLEKRIALAELEDNNNSLESPVCVNNNGNNIMSDDDQYYEKLLQLLKSEIPSDSLKFMADNLLLDFFRERLMVDDDKAGLELGLDLVKVAEDWVNGNPRELIRGWEVHEEGRQAYVKEMDRIDNWGNLNEEQQDLESEVEVEVFSWLVDELLTDLF